MYRGSKHMTNALKILAEEIVQLRPKARAFLAERLLESLEHTDLEEAWKTEAKQRRDEIRSGKVKPVNAEEVYRRIEKLLKR
jgi:putative addiction module component (TIGR02574 family)